MNLARGLRPDLGSRLAPAALALALVPLTAACRDDARYSSRGDHWEGEVSSADFVRAGIARGTRLCLVLDATKLSESPGTIATSDGRFAGVRLRAVPQSYHDPLSTLTFGDGRLESHVYAARPRADGGAAESDVTAVLSLTSDDDVELRLLRGAPGELDDVPATAPVFGVFHLARAAGPCPF